MKTIKLTQGKEAIVDDEDFDRLSQYRWFYSSNGYAARKSTNKQGRCTVRMHREILGVKCVLKEVDHKNGDRLDNRKNNLRTATRAENNRNAKKRKTNSSGFKGVSFNKGKNKYRAQITKDRKYIFIGYFDNAEEAAIEYDKAADQLHGQFANHNQLSVTRQ